MSPQVESSKALAAVMNRRNYDRERIGEDVDIQITRLVCLPGFFRRCKVKIWGQERFYYLPLRSLDNSQQGKGKVFRIKQVGCILYRHHNGIQGKSQAVACSTGKVR